MLFDVYRGARILITGDTGFKGSWLAVWLNLLGAEIHGLALPAEAGSLFVAANIESFISHTHADLRDFKLVQAIVNRVRPNLIFHLGAQAIVRESYADPLGTMLTNVMGTAHICEALRHSSSPSALVVVTSDKCYENNEWVHGYREVDPLGGADPYSASKGAAEIVTSSWRRSFFPSGSFARHGRAIATARAGNVIGPGDWAKDRIVPDAIRALSAGKPILVRNPRAVRPWQHVLEPLAGYLCLGARLLSPLAARYAEAWNFGPLPGSMQSVEALVNDIVRRWGNGGWTPAEEANPPPESHTLRLTIDKAVAQLDWYPVWDFARTIEQTVGGYRRLLDCADSAAAARKVLENEIATFHHAAGMLGVPWTRDR